MSFKALVVFETAQGFKREVVEKHFDELPEGDVLIRVKFSSLNYKDALSASGNKGITKNFPHTPGIDAAGVVELSKNEEFASGDEVIVTGFDMGMNTSGGLAEYIRVPASWIVSKPNEYTLRECMAIGTAGLTAAIGLKKIQAMEVHPDAGPVVITGASGGVGSLAVTLFNKAGYEVIAVTGKADAHDYLRQLGANRIEPRAFVNDLSGKNLIRPRWAAALDTVGGNTLATLLKGCMAEGCVVSTGLVASPRLDTTVYPFILNGVSLLGVGSAETPMTVRQYVWTKLAHDWNIQPKLKAVIREISLEEVDGAIEKMLQGKTTGRIVVKL